MKFVRRLDSIAAELHAICQIDIDILTLKCTPSIQHIWGPLYLYGLTFIPVWISNYIHYKVFDEIAYPFLNFNGEAVEVW